jgi:hypothetical protein
MADPIGSIDVVEKLVHIFGIPAIVGVIVWLIRQYDATQRTFTALHENTKLAVARVAEVKSAVDVIQTNHLKHLEDSMISLAKSHADANSILVSIDKGIAVLVDRKEI